MADPLAPFGGVSVLSEMTDDDKAVWAATFGAAYTFLHVESGLNSAAAAHEAVNAADGAVIRLQGMRETPRET